MNDLHTNSATTATQQAAEAGERDYFARWKHTEPDQAGQVAPSHVVLPGDTIESIARARLGDAARWMEVRALNITHPHDHDLCADETWPVGTLLALPSDAVELTDPDDLTLSVLMQPWSLNLVVGKDRDALLSFGRMVWAQAQAEQKASLTARTSSPVPGVFTTADADLNRLLDLTHALGDPAAGGHDLGVAHQDALEVVLKKLAPMSASELGSLVTAPIKLPTNRLEREEDAKTPVGQIMGFAQRWRYLWQEFQRPYNQDSDTPVTEQQVEQAEINLRAATQALIACAHAEGSNRSGS